jgi:hypothetical protein
MINACVFSGAFEMKFVSPIMVGVLALSLQGCSAKDSTLTVVTLHTDANGKVASTKITKSSGDMDKDAYAVTLAKNYFKSKVPHPQPSQTYRQPVEISEVRPLIAKDKGEADAKAKPKSASGSTK